MREMVWDEELAGIAQRWAEQCTPQHDLMRNVGKGRAIFVLSIMCHIYREVCSWSERGPHLVIPESTAKRRKLRVQTTHQQLV